MQYLAYLNPMENVYPEYEETVNFFLKRCGCINRQAEMPEYGEEDGKE